MEDPTRFPEEFWNSVTRPGGREALELFAERLVAEGELRGLIGPRELPRLWSRHIANSLCILPAISTGSRVGDLGSGAGFPGLVLAAAREDLDLVLIEPMERRCDWLRECAEALGLDNVAVRRARAEELAGNTQFDVVTARAVAAMSKLARLALPLVRPGGKLLALKGQKAEMELADGLPELRRLGARSWGVQEVRSPLDGEVTRLVVVAK